MNDRRHFFRNLGTMGVSLATGMAIMPTSKEQNLSTTQNHSLVLNPAQDHWNAKIQRDRDIALQILKPTKKELDRGLALHKESVVFDTYGFMPRAAYDGDLLAAAIEDGAS